MDNFTQQGIAALKAGNKSQARQLLTQAVRQNKKDVLAWYALSFAVDKQKDQIFCLQQVLQIDPNHAKAQQRLAKITAQSQPVEPETTRAAEAGAVKEEGETAVVTQSDQTTAATAPTTTARLKQAFLGEPYLPKPLAFLAILILLSDSLVILTGQSASYWQNFGIGSTFFPWLTLVIRIHPLLFIATILISAVILWAAFRYLSYKPAIIIWMIVSYQHLRSFVGWTRCSLESIFTLSYSTCTAVDVTLTILAGLLLGIALAVTLWPRDSSRQVWEKASTKRLQVSKGLWIGSGIWLAFLLIVLTWVVLTPPEGWLLLDMEQLPPARVNGGLVYDTDRQRAVLFGGGSEYLGGEWYDWQPLGDTWEWDGNAWQEQTAAASPPPRLNPAMAYDPIRKVTVLYGGLTPEGVLGDTWEWDGQQWQQLFPTNTIQSMCCATMFFDPQRGQVVMHSGYAEGDFYPTATLAWDGEDWQTIADDSEAPLGANVPYAYENGRSQALAYFPLWGTYIWNSESWQQILPESESPNRSDAALAYEPNQELSILFGGKEDEKSTNDTWQFDGSTWEQLTLPANPEALAAHMMFYDESRGTIILFGGIADSEVRNAMWELHLP